MTDSKSMDEQGGAGLDIGWFYYILFRHKWKIVAFFLAGFAAAAAVYRFEKPLAQSSASLLIKYVRDPGVDALNTTKEAAAQIKETDARGENIITAETEILRSLDLAEEVAKELTPQTVLQDTGV